MPAGKRGRAGGHPASCSCHVRGRQTTRKIEARSASSATKEASRIASAQESPWFGSGPATLAAEQEQSLGAYLIDGWYDGHAGFAAPFLQWDVFST